MSVQAVAWVLESANVSKPHLLPVLMGLANHAGQDGEGSYPSVQTLSWYSRKTERQVQKDLRELEIAGAIRRGNQEMVLHIPEAARPVVYDLAMSFAPEQNRIRPSKRRKGRPTRENIKPPVVHDTPISSPVCPIKNPLSYTTPPVVQGKNPLSYTTPEPTEVTVHEDLPYPSQEMGTFSSSLEERKANCGHGKPTNCRPCGTSPRGRRRLEEVSAAEVSRLQREYYRRELDALEAEQERKRSQEFRASWCGSCEGHHPGDRYVVVDGVRTRCACHPLARALVSA